MWAVAPETEGVSCGFGDPIEDALCKRPELRGLRPRDLAQALGVTPAKAQIAILEVAAKATGKRITFEGVSLDEALGQSGGSAPPTSLRYSEDAGGLFDTIAKAVSDVLPLAIGLAVAVAIALEKREG